MENVHVDSPNIWAMVDDECGQLQDHANSSSGSLANFLRNQIGTGAHSIDMVIYI